MASGKPVTFGPWPEGMDNVSTDAAVSGKALRDAVNVDVMDDGTMRRRSGVTARVAGIARSVFSDGRALFAVVGGVLTKYTRLPSGALSGVALRSGLSTISPLSYAQVGSDVFYSNNGVNGKIVGNVSRPWGVERPGGTPTLTAITSGALFEGRYKVAVTFVDAQGEESGTGSAAVVSVAENGGISLTLIPQPTTPEVTTIRVYVSEANGKLMYRNGDYAVGTTSLVITRSTTLGKILDTQFMVPPVPGKLLESFNGRIYIARGNALYFTEPQRYGLMREGGNLMFEDDIRIVKDGEVGLWVVTASSTLFLEGNDPANFSPQERLAYGAARGTATKLSGGKLFWMSSQGPVVANLQGQIEDLTDERGEPLVHVATEAGVTGAATYIEKDGVRQVITCVRGSERRTLVASDYLDLTGVYA